MSCFQCGRQGKRRHQYTAEGLYAASAACLRRKGLLSEKPPLLGIRRREFLLHAVTKWFFLKTISID